MMDADLRQGLEHFLAPETSEETSAKTTATEPPRIVDIVAVGGGSIHAAWRLTLSDGRTLFAKSGPSSTRPMFECESVGLRALGQPDVLRIPEVLGVGDSRRWAFLVMEMIEPGGRDRDFFQRFGEGFAELHRRTRHPKCGFEHANFIGATPQPNPWMGDWCQFWRDHRLGHQLRLARDSGRSDATLDRLADRLLERLEDWLDVEEPFCLLHGDLWSGNFLVDESGEPVLIDPAVYYGHREADLAMTQLFGGFSPEFYRAYESTWPLPAGSAERLMIYRLYHLLNHLNLFGRGYAPQCVDILRRLVA